MIGLNAYGFSPSPIMTEEAEVDWEELEKQDPTPIDAREETPKVGKEGVKRHEPDDDSRPKLQIHVFKRPKGLGIASEFLIATLDGKVKLVSLVSTGYQTEGDHATPDFSTWAKIAYRKRSASGLYLKMDNGFYESLESTNPLDQEPGKAPFPFRISYKYKSEMYWGLHISGGYWIHSTPHVSRLGRPASMGCVRVSHPSAMELFDLAVNEAQGNAWIKIYPPTSAGTERKFEELAVSAKEVRAALKSDYLDANQYADKSGDFLGNVLARRGKKLQIPKCGREDCFPFFGESIRLGKPKQAK